MDIIMIFSKKSALEMICYGKIKCLFMFLYNMTLVLNFRFIRYVKIKWAPGLKFPQATKSFKTCKQN